MADPPPTMLGPQDGAPPAARLRGAGWIGLALGALLPLALVAAFAVAEVVRAYRETDDRRLHDTVVATAAALDARLQAYETAMTVLSLTPGIVDEHDLAPLLARAWAAAEALGGWIVVLGPPPDCTLLGSTLRPLLATPVACTPEVDLAHRRAFERLQAGARSGISDLFTGPLTGRPVLSLLVPLRSEGRISGVLGLGVEPGRIRDAMGWEDRPGGSYALVVDGAGRVLADSRGEEGVPVGEPIPAGVLQRIGGRRHGIVAGPELDGQGTIFAFERLKAEPGWVAIVAEPRGSRAASTTRLVAWILAAVGALSLALGLLVWMRRSDAVRTARQEAAALRAGRAEVERLHGGMPAVLFLMDMPADGQGRLAYLAGDIGLVTGWPEGPRLRDGDWSDSPGAPFAAFLRRVMAEGKGATDWQMRQPDGSHAWMRTYARRLSLRADGSAEIVGYVLNVDAELKAAARAAAAGRLSSLGEMAAGLAHELKQPLLAISLLAETAQIASRRGEGAHVQRNLDGIVGQTDRAAGIIENLRRFARGTPEGEATEPVPLDHVVRQTLGLAAVALREAEIEVEVSLGDPPPRVLGHAIGIEQVLLNLLLNARDAMAGLPAGAPRRIRIAAAPWPGAEGAGAPLLRLTVEDTGGGIRPEVLERLFQPFVTTKGPEKGTGLGLSISHGLIRAMGGTIEAWNGPQGAVFAITLPAAPTA